jgi:hypothetical protein
MFFLIEELICSRTFCLYCQTPSPELVDRHNRDFMVVGNQCLSQLHVCECDSSPSRGAGPALSQLDPRWIFHF